MLKCGTTVVSNLIIRFSGLNKNVFDTPTTYAIDHHSIPALMFTQGRRARLTINLSEYSRAEDGSNDSACLCGCLTAGGRV